VVKNMSISPSVQHCQKRPHASTPFSDSPSIFSRSHCL
jgi:hypothetical protein